MSNQPAEGTTGAFATREDYENSVTGRHDSFIWYHLMSAVCSHEQLAELIGVWWWEF